MVHREAVTQEEAILVAVLAEAAEDTPVVEAAVAVAAVPDAIDKQNKVVKRPPYLFTCMRALVRCEHMRRI